MFEKVVRAHLSLSTLREKLPAIGVKRVVLTHMGEDMLSRLPDVEFETATDGKVIAL
jgi:phosphoribosyl 1,2-cyclic phosphodiesterase